MAFEKNRRSWIQAALLAATAGEDVAQTLPAKAKSAPSYRDVTVQRKDLVGVQVKPWAGADRLRQLFSAAR